MCNNRYLNIDASFRRNVQMSFFLPNFDSPSLYVAKYMRGVLQCESIGIRCSVQLTLRACMTTSWASSSPSRTLRRVSSSALLRASTFIFSSWGDREGIREEILLLITEKKLKIQSEWSSQEVKMLLGVKWIYVYHIALSKGLSECVLSVCSTELI